MQIDGLKTKIQKIENIHQEHKKEKRIREVEKVIKCRDSKFKCKECEHTTGSEQSLKTQISKKQNPLKNPQTSYDLVICVTRFD